MTLKTLTIALLTAMPFAVHAADIQPKHNNSEDTVVTEVSDTKKPVADQKTVNHKATFSAK